MEVGRGWQGSVDVGRGGRGGWMWIWVVGVSRG